MQPLCFVLFLSAASAVQVSPQASPSGSTFSFFGFFSPQKLIEAALPKDLPEVGMKAKTAEARDVEVLPKAVVETEPSTPQSDATAPAPNATEAASESSLDNSVKAIAKPRRTRTSREESLINSLQHLDDDTHTVGCVTHCRFGDEVRHTWRECIERCVENPLMRSSMMQMLPKEHHDAHDMEKQVPESIKMSAQVRRKYRLDRGSEL